VKTAKFVLKNVKITERGYISVYSPRDSTEGDTRQQLQQQRAKVNV